MAEGRRRRFLKRTTAGIVCVVFAAICCCVEGLEDSRDHSLVSRIAFGSCSNHTFSSSQVPSSLHSTAASVLYIYIYIELNRIIVTSSVCFCFRLKPIIWNSIVDFNPDVFIWLGDNIYGDIRRPFRVFGKERTVGPWKNVPRFSPSSEDEMESRYLMAKNSPGYSTLRRSAKVLGTNPQRDGSFHFFIFYFLKFKLFAVRFMHSLILPLPLILLWLPNHQL